MVLLKKRKIRLGSKTVNTHSNRLQFEDELFIGIDLSMTDTGIVVMHDDRSLVRAFSIKTTVKHGLDDTRAAMIVDQVMDVIREYSDGGQKVYVFLEAIPFAKRATGKLFTRYGIYATLKYFLRKEGYDAYTIGNTTLKNRFAGKGTADKDAIIKAIFTKYRLVIKNNNIADAFAAASVGVAFKREKMRLSIEKIPLA